MPAPYYDAGGVTLYHADCRDVLDDLRADVLITDPPYGVGLVTRSARPWHRRGPNMPIAPATVTYADDPGDVAALVADVIPRALARVERGLVFPGTRMLWNYPPAAALGAVFNPAGAGAGSAWGFQTSTPVLFYGPDPYLADGRGRRPNGVLHLGRGTAGYPREVFDHPCPKPIEYMTWAVERASRPGETILDPFAGAGTTLLAARLCGRQAIGVEIVEHYCKIAVGRLAQGVLDLWAAD
jgi:site-specific DNA-methyltransferase (adenine-specific)